MNASSTRPPAVAGTFYPAEADTLMAQVNGYLYEASDQGPAEASSTPPKAIIAPHAGYIYSGPIAASVYARLQPWHEIIQRVIMIGPAHRVFVEGLATSGADSFSTPLGTVPLDREAIEKIVALPQVEIFDEAHRMEHSLEVHLPFLQQVLDDFTLVPMIFGRARADQIAEVLEQVWGDEHTLIVISSDLSHYHNYAEASSMDRQAAQAIQDLAPDQLSGEQACGQKAIQALLLAAKKHGLKPSLLDLRNSGDTAGTRDRVVGYGAFEFRSQES